MSNATKPATATQPITVPTAPRTVVEEGTRFRGVISSQHAVLVQGDVEGEVTGPHVTIGKGGSVNGKVATNALESAGSISGQFDVGVAQLTGTVAKTTVIRASTLDVNLTAERGKLQLTFAKGG